MITRTTNLLQRKIGRDFAAATTSSVLVSATSSSSTNEDVRQSKTPSVTIPRADNPNDHLQTEVKNNKNNNNINNKQIDMGNFFPSAVAPTHNHAATTIATKKTVVASAEIIAAKKQSPAKAQKNSNTKISSNTNTNTKKALPDQFNPIEADSRFTSEEKSILEMYDRAVAKELDRLSQATGPAPDTVGVNAASSRPSSVHLPSPSERAIEKFAHEMELRRKLQLDRQLQAAGADAVAMMTKNAVDEAIRENAEVSAMTEHAVDAATHDRNALRTMLDSVADITRAAVESVVGGSDWAMNALEKMTSESLEQVDENLAAAAVAHVREQATAAVVRATKIQRNNQIANKKSSLTSSHTQEMEEEVAQLAAITEAAVDTAAVAATQVPTREVVSAALSKALEQHRNLHFDQQGFDLDENVDHEAQLRSHNRAEKYALRRKAVDAAFNVTETDEEWEILQMTKEVIDSKEVAAEILEDMEIARMTKAAVSSVKKSDLISDAARAVDAVLEEVENEDIRLSKEAAAIVDSIDEQEINAAVDAADRERQLDREHEKQMVQTAQLEAKHQHEEREAREIAAEKVRAELAAQEALAAAEELRLAALEREKKEKLAAAAIAEIEASKARDAAAAIAEARAIEEAKSIFSAAELQRQEAQQEEIVAADATTTIASELGSLKESDPVVVPAVEAVVEDDLEAQTALALDAVTDEEVAAAEEEARQQQQTRIEEAEARLQFEREIAQARERQQKEAAALLAARIEQQRVEALAAAEQEELRLAKAKEEEEEKQLAAIAAAEEHQRMVAAANQKIAENIETQRKLQEQQLAEKKIQEEKRQLAEAEKKAEEEKELVNLQRQKAQKDEENRLAEVARALEQQKVQEAIKKAAAAEKEEKAARELLAQQKQKQQEEEENEKRAIASAAAAAASEKKKLAELEKEQHHQKQKISKTSITSNKNGAKKQVSQVVSAAEVKIETEKVVEAVNEEKIGAVAEATKPSEKVKSEQPHQAEVNTVSAATPSKKDQVTAVVDEIVSKQLDQTPIIENEKPVVDFSPSPSSWEQKFEKYLQQKKQQNTVYQIINNKKIEVDANFYNDPNPVVVEDVARVVVVNPVQLPKSIQNRMVMNLQKSAAPFQIRYGILAETAQHQYQYMVGSFAFCGSAVYLYWLFSRKN